MGKFIKALTNIDLHPSTSTFYECGELQKKKIKNGPNEVLQGHMDIENPSGPPL